MEGDIIEITWQELLEKIETLGQERTGPFRLSDRDDLKSTDAVTEPPCLKLPDWISIYPGILKNFSFKNIICLKKADKQTTGGTAWLKTEALKV